VVRFAVGTRVRWARAGQAFGRLTANRDRLAVSAVFSKAVLERKHVEAVYIRRVLLRRAIAFDTKDRSGVWVYVYAFRLRRILTALKELGWPVVE
jgi:hypothetical protein